MKKMYLSGKISGLPIEEARANFAKAEAVAKSLGYLPVNPMNLHNGNENMSWEDYMRTDIKAMMDCDAIMIQPNYRSSSGARIEVGLAINLAMPRCYFDGEVVKFFK